MRNALLIGAALVGLFLLLAFVADLPLLKLEGKLFDFPKIDFKF